MNIQFLFVFGFLFQTISCLVAVSNILDYLCLTGNGNNGWEDKVQQCYDGCVEVFETYPKEIFDIGDNLIDSFKSYIDAAKMWNKSNSTIMSLRSTNLLETIALLANLGTSPRYSLYVHRKANPNLFRAYRAIVSYLLEFINKLTQPISDDLTDLEQSFDDLFVQFNRLCLINCNTFDFGRIMKSGQRLANSISLIVHTALNHPSSDTIANNTYEAIAILVYILFDNFLNIQGAIISKAAMLKYQFITAFHRSCLLSLDPFIRGIAGSMNTMTMYIEKEVRDLLASLLDHMINFNNALHTLLGPFEGVAFTAQHVFDNLLKYENKRRR